MKTKSNKTIKYNKRGAGGDDTNLYSLDQRSNFWLTNKISLVATRVSISVRANKLYSQVKLSS
jgi:hypothetical protein